MQRLYPLSLYVSRSPRTKISHSTSMLGMWRECLGITVANTYLSCCKDDGCDLRAVTPLCEEGEGEGLEKDGGDKRAKELQLPPEGRSSLEALLWISSGVL